MGMEIPGVVPSGIHSDVKATEGRSDRQDLRIHRAEVLQKSPATELDIRRDVEKLEKMVAQFNRRFDISINENIGRIIIKVIDTDTDKVIKEIPPEEIQHMVQRLQEMVGLLVDERI